MYLLGDIGGTKTRIAIIPKIYSDFKQTYKALKQSTKIFNTPQKYEDFLELIKNYILRSSASVLRSSALKVCFGFAGNFDLNKEKLIYAPNLKDYVGRNLKKDLEKIFNKILKIRRPSLTLRRLSQKKPSLSFSKQYSSFGLHEFASSLRKSAVIFLENDAALAGLGEAYFGAGKNFKVFGYITLGTGIGGVKIVNKKIDDNVFGFEPGHSLILIQNKAYNILPFEVEELVGGKNLEKIFKKKPEEIKDKKFWDDLSKILAIFLVNVSIFWSVDKIVLGGGLIKAINFKKLEGYLKNFYPLPLKIKLIKSKVSNFSALLGCLAYLEKIVYN